MKLFLVLTEELHFGRAAARTYMTQAAFSQQIRALEDRLGVRLIERSSRTVELTHAGHDLLPEARTIVTTMNRLSRAAEIHARELAGHLTVGAIGAEAAMPYTSAILDELQARHPKMAVEIRLLNFADQITALTSGDVDVAFLRPPVPPGIQLQHLASEPRVAALRAADPLAGRANLTLAQLARYPVADIPPEAPRVWWNDWVVDPRPNGTPIRYGPVVVDVEGLLHAVAGGQVVAFLPSAARDLFPRPGVRYVDVTDLPPCTSALAWLPKRSDHPAVAAIRNIAERLTPARRKSSGEST